MRMSGWLIGVTLLALLPLDSTSAKALAPDRALPWVTEEVRMPRVVFRTFASAVIGREVSYHAYLPEQYDHSEQRLPVLYWLHGTEGGTSGIRPLANLFGDAMAAGRIPPMIVVFVNGLPRRLWADSKDGSTPVETVFVTELIPEVDRSFRTLASREGRVLEGFSMGGYGAARLGLKYPQAFAGVSILAGGPFDLDLQGPRAQRNPRLREEILREVCGGELDYFRQISPWEIAGAAASSIRSHRTVIRQAVGSLDDTRLLNWRFHGRMQALGIAHDYREVPGVAHEPRRLLERLLEIDGSFYSRALGLSAPPAIRSDTGRRPTDPRRERQ